MDSFLALEASTQMRRNPAIQGALAALTAHGGFVTGTEMLGGLALLLRIELPSEAVLGLEARLDQAGIDLDAQGRAALDAAGLAGTGVVGSILLRFYASEPDLKIDIPKVPG